MTWDKLSLREKSELMRTYVRNGVTSLGDIKLHYNEFKEGGNKDITQLKDNTNIIIPRNIKNIPLSVQDLNRISIQNAGTITPMTPEQRYKMELEKIREKIFSERYADKRIAAAKKGISAVTAVTSFVPGPIGVSSRGINLLLDTEEYLQQPNSAYNTTMVTAGGAKALGSSNVLRPIPKIGKYLDSAIDGIGHVDTADDITFGEVSKEIKTITTPRKK